jgi:hypothetical protein
MKQISRPASRKKFLIWSGAILSSLTFLKIFAGRKKPEKNVVKMLTQNGQLVEVDKNLISAAGKKISNQELQHWIKK